MSGDDVLTICHAVMCGDMVARMALADVVMDMNGPHKGTLRGLARHRGAVLTRHHQRALRSVRLWALGGCVRKGGV